MPITCFGAKIMECKLVSYDEPSCRLVGETSTFVRKNVSLVILFLSIVKHFFLYTINEYGDVVHI